MLHILLVVLFGVFSLIAGIISLELPLVSFVFAAYYIYFGLSSFPYPKEDRHKRGLAIGCIIFVLAGVLTVAFGSWWFITAGMIFGYSAAYLIPSN